MSTPSTVGFPFTGWSGTAGNKPYYYVSVNGPYDGGDFGPNTISTTTNGVQEAVNAAQTAIAAGAGGGVVVLGFGVSTTGTVTISKSNVTLMSLVNAESNGATASTPTIGALTIKDVASAGILNGIRIQGINVPGILTLQTTNTGGQYWRFEDCAFGCVYVNSNVAEIPAEIYFLRCMLEGNNATYTSCFTALGSLGQTTFDTCQFFLTASSTKCIYCTADTTSLFMTNCEVYTNGSLTSLYVVFFDAGSVYNLSVQSMYIESPSPITLFNFTSDGDVDLYCQAQFTDVVNASTGTLTLINNSCVAVNWAGSSFSSFAKFTNISARGVVALGTQGAFSSSGGVQQFRCVVENVPGLQPAGFNSVTAAPAFPGSTSYAQNTYPWTIQAIVTGVGSGITAYTVEDIYGNTSSQTVSVISSETFILSPGESIKFTYTGSPTWVWRGI